MKSLPEPEMSQMYAHGGQSAAGTFEPCYLVEDTGYAQSRELCEHIVSRQYTAADQRFFQQFFLSVLHEGVPPFILIPDKKPHSLLTVRQNILHLATSYPVELVLEHTIGYYTEAEYIQHQIDHRIVG